MAPPGLAMSICLEKIGSLGLSRGRGGEESGVVEKKVKDIPGSDS